MPTTERYFVFEGLDGSGKSTQCRMLADALHSRGYPVTLTKEPTDGPWGQQIREMARSNKRVTPQQELEWFIHDRKEHIEQLIQPTLSKGHILIQDRYFLSTMAYQGSRGLDPQTILAQHLTFAPLPCRTFLLDLPPEVGLERVRKRQSTPDAFETLDALQKCAAIFHEIELEGLTRLPAEQPPQELHKEILAIVLEELETHTET